jgi:hypothetical protein
VNRCVHNEGDAVFIPLQIFWKNVYEIKKTKQPPGVPEGCFNITHKQTELRKP